MVTIEADMTLTHVGNAEYIAHHIGISMNTLHNLYDALGHEGEPVTAVELAERMGITVRSVNRILEKLDDQGYVSTVSRYSAGL